MTIDSSHHDLDSEVVLYHATVLARVGGAAAVTPDLVAQRCRATVDQLPEDLRTERSLRLRTSPRAVAAMAEHLQAAVDGQQTGAAILRELGLAYISFAEQEPGWFDLAMFTMPSMANSHLESARSSTGKTPYEYLDDAFHQLAREGRLTYDDIASASMTAWAGVHGFATLATRGPLRSSDPQLRSVLAHKVVDRLVEASAPPHAMV